MQLREPLIRKVIAVLLRLIAPLELRLALKAHVRPSVSMRLPAMVAG
jgi:hypothetical protein